LENGKKEKGKEKLLENGRKRVAIKRENIEIR
jgi:hypothetical protein